MQLFFYQLIYRYCAVNSIFILNLILIYLNLFALSFLICTATACNPVDCRTSACILSQPNKLIQHFTFWAKLTGTSSNYATPVTLILTLRIRTHTNSAQVRIRLTISDLSATNSAPDLKFLNVGYAYTLSLVTIVEMNVNLITNRFYL